MNLTISALEMAKTLTHSKVRHQKLIFGHESQREYKLVAVRNYKQDHARVSRLIKQRQSSLICFAEGQIVSL